MVIIIIIINRNVKFDSVNTIVTDERQKNIEAQKDNRTKYKQRRFCTVGGMGKTSFFTYKFLCMKEGKETYSFNFVLVSYEGNLFYYFFFSFSNFDMLITVSIKKRVPKKLCIACEIIAFQKTDKTSPGLSKRCPASARKRSSFLVTWYVYIKAPREYQF